MHRHMHTERGSVYAHRQELEAWWERRRHNLEGEAAGTGQEAGVNDRRLPRWAPVGLVAVAACLLAWRGDPSSLTPRVVAPALPHRLFAYATSEGGSLRRIPTVRRPSLIAVSPGGETLYITNWQDAVLVTLSTATLRTTGTIRLSGPPEALAVTHDGRTVYAGTLAGDVDVVDVSSRSLRTVHVGGSVRDLALTPDDELLFITTGFAGVKRLDTATGKVTTFAGVACPMYLALNPAGTQLFVSYQCGGPGGRHGHDAIDFVDVRSGAGVGTVSGPPLVGGPIAVSPDGASLWVDGGDACISPAYDHAGCPQVPGGVVHVIRTSDRTVMHSLGLPPAGHRLSFLPGGESVVLPSQPIQVIDTSTLAATETLDLGNVDHVVFSPEGRRAFIPLQDQNEVAVLNLTPRECEPPSNGLAHFWPTDGNANDVSSGLHGVLTGDVTFAPGRFGRAFSFTGSGLVNLGVQSPEVASSPDSTLLMWVKFASLGTEMALIGRMTESRTEGWRLFKDASDRLALCATDGVRQATCSPGAPMVLTAPARIQANVWHHVALTKKGALMTLFLDGAPVGSADFSRLIVSERDIETRIGAGYREGYFHGLIDELAVYRRALSPAEITSIMETPGRAECSPWGKPSF